MHRRPRHDSSEPRVSRFSAHKFQMAYLHSWGRSNGERHPPSVWSIRFVSHMVLSSARHRPACRWPRVNLSCPLCDPSIVLEHERETPRKSSWFRLGWRKEPR